MIERAYEAYISRGFDPELFWDLSLVQISDVIEAYDKRVTEEFKVEARKAYTQAMQIADMVYIGISALLGKDPSEPAHLYDYYPKLFEVEKEREEQEKQKDKPKMTREMEMYAAQMRDYAERFNIKFQKDGESK